MSAPNDIMKSVYWLPSASHTCEPLPRSSMIGPPEYTAAPREGEFTPSTNDRCARSNNSRERVRFSFVLGCAMNSVRRTAAIHNQGGTGHERGVFAGEKQRRLRNLIRCADPPQGPVGAACEVILPLQATHAGIFRKHGSVHVARADAVDANALAPVINRHRFGQQDHATLRRTVGYCGVTAHDAPSRAVINNDATS